LLITACADAEPAVERHEALATPDGRKENTMDSILPIIRAALGLVAAAGLIAFALARRRRRTLIELRLVTPAAASQPAAATGI
jgi:hypothetical protein